MLKRLIGYAFPWVGVIVFLAAIGGYWYSEAPAPSGDIRLLSDSDTPVQDAEDDSWYSVRYKDQRIGWTHSRRLRDGDGWKTLDTMHLKMTLMGQPRDVVSRTEAKLNAKGQIKTFTFRMESAGVNIDVEGVQTPDELQLKLISAGSEQKVEYPLEKPIVMSANLYRVVAEAGLEPGKVYMREFFDPSVLKPSKMRIKILEKDEIKVGARTIPVYQVLQKYNGLETVSWIDKKGRLYKEESPTGFSTYRTTKEDAQKEGEGQALDLIDATSVKAENAASNPRELKYLKLRLKGIDVEGFQLDGDGQSLAGDVLEIDRRKSKGSEIEAAKYLDPEPLMQVGAPEVKKAVLEATGGLREAPQASRRILKWVYKNLAKTSTVSLPSAVEVLRTRQGDCNEHAVLYTTMARAAAIPARIASGVVALEKRFYYHAWTEIYLDGAWVAVDPVFGQYPADATHIRFVTGGLERQAELMRVIGKLEIEVLAYE